MDYLTRNTKSLLNSGLARGDHISAKDCDVIVVGGGDTGTDCIGTASVTAVVVSSISNCSTRPPTTRAPDNSWPEWPRIFRRDYSHEEHQEKFREDPRVYSILSKEILGDETGRVTGIKTVRIDWSRPSGALSLPGGPGNRENLEGGYDPTGSGFSGTGNDAGQHAESGL